MSRLYNARYFAPWGGRFELKQLDKEKEDTTMTKKLTQEQKDKNKTGRGIAKSTKKKMVDVLESKDTTKMTCCVCSKVILEKAEYKILLADETHPRRHYHVVCGPGSESWTKWLESQGKKTKIKPVFKDKDGKKTREPKKHKDGNADRLIALLKTQKGGMSMAEIKKGMDSKSTFYQLCKKLETDGKVKKDEKLFVAV